jgi:hypothetical protein
MKSKGFFTTIIIALLILLTLELLLIQINYKNNIYHSEKELIEIKNLTYARSEFEYNLSNAIKNQLDNELLITQEQPILKTNTDNLVKQILLDYDILGTLSSGLLLNVFPCGELNCAYYRYSVLLPIMKEISLNNKTIDIGIPLDYSVDNTVVIP